MLPLPTETLEELLLMEGLVTKEQFNSALQVSQALNRPLEEVLVAENYISEIVISKILAKYYKLPFIELANNKIELEVIKIIPETVAKQHHLVAFAKDDQNKQLKVALDNPRDADIVKWLAQQTGLTVLPHIATERDIKKVLFRYRQGELEEFKHQISDKIQGLFKEDAGAIIKVIDILLESALGENASDIHIEGTAKNLIIRYRIDGILHDILVLPSQVQAAIVTRIKVLANLPTDEHRLPLDGRFKIVVGGKHLAIRVSIMPAYFGEKIVLRLLPEAMKHLKLEELGLQDDDLEKVRRNMRKSHGLILVTGPTNSGKTTTLYSILNILNTPEVNIATIEDPIEYGMNRVNQTQANPKVGLTFATGLRSLLRQDPNIIMVGEIRDLETAEMTIQAALTGHLVLSTVHTNSAILTIPRLLDMGVEPFLLASTINVIIAQRLVRRICQYCIEEYSVGLDVLEPVFNAIDPNEIRRVLNTEIAQQTKKVHLARGQGCEKCNNTGYSTRIGIYETLEIDDELKDLILHHASAQEIKELAAQKGMTSLLADGLMKAVSGITTIEEVIRVVRE